MPDPCPTLLEIPVSCFSKPCGSGGSSALANPPYDWTPTQIAGLAYWKTYSNFGNEYYSKSPAVTYSMQGTLMKVPPSGPTIQYPVFDWAWAGFTSTQTDHREVYYPTQNEWRLACWDDGGERGQPIHGYIDFTLTFPKGTYSLTIYAYDLEASRTSETFNIYDVTGTHLLASQQISNNLPVTGSNTFANGVYETFKVTVSGYSGSIILQVYNDLGHNTVAPSNNNVVLSGIFVNKM